MTGHSTERWSHWTASGTARIEPTELARQEFYRLWFRDAGAAAEIDLGLFVSVERAAESLFLGEHDQGPFQPSKCGFPAATGDWNGLR